MACCIGCTGNNHLRGVERRGTRDERRKRQKKKEKRKNETRERGEKSLTSAFLPFIVQFDSCNTSICFHSAFHLSQLTESLFSFSTFDCSRTAQLRVKHTACTGGEEDDEEGKMLLHLKETSMVTTYTSLSSPFASSRSWRPFFALPCSRCPSSLEKASRGNRKHIQTSKSGRGGEKNEHLLRLSVWERERERECIFSSSNTNNSSSFTRFAHSLLLSLSLFLCISSASRAEGQCEKLRVHWETRLSRMRSRGNYWTGAIIASQEFNFALSICFAWITLCASLFTS